MGYSRVAWAVLALAVVLSGCGARPRPVYPARGQLTIGGRPAGGGFVLLHPPDAPEAAPPRPSGTTDADGSVRLTTRAAGDGAPAGTYAVTLLYEPSTSPLAARKERPPKIDGKYLKPDTTPLRAAVQAAPVNEL